MGFFEEWLSYRPRDLLLFSQDTYLRQFERFNEVLLPAPYLAWCGGLLGLLLLLRGRGIPPRPLLASLALLYGAVGYGFLWRLYAQINWSMDYLLWLFVAQGLVLLGLALAGRPRQRSAQGSTWPTALLWTIALLGFPAVEYASGRAFSELSAFVLAPDPLVVLSIGLLLNWQVHWLWILPGLLWLLASALTLWAMESAEALLLFAVLASIPALRRRVTNSSMG